MRGRTFKKYLPASLTFSIKSYFLVFSHFWLATPQEVLQADWQEVWHSPQPPFLTLLERSRVTSVRILFIVILLIQIKILINGIIIPHWALIVNIFFGICTIQAQIYSITTEIILSNTPEEVRIFALFSMRDVIFSAIPFEITSPGTRIGIPGG